MHTGRGRVFRNHEITPDVLLASACLPTMFQAIEIDGEPYWDGGFSGNPTLTPLILESDARDTVLVQINPVRAQDTPRTARDIASRMNEVSFNAVLLKELRMIAVLRQVVDAGRGEGARWARMRIHRIHSAMMVLRNLFEPLAEHASGLRHVTLLQGTKAYGVHVRPIRIPAREDRDEMYEEPNFYWEQEDYLKARRKGASWHWTVFRPQVIFGESFGSAMNLIPAIGAYAALLAEAGEPLHYPGGNPNLTEGVDADLLARAIAWAQDTPAAADQTFNITNGDVFLWQNVWPAIADALGMAPGNAVPQCLADEMPKRAADWDRIRERHGLLSPDLASFVGLSFQYAELRPRLWRRAPRRPGAGVDGEAPPGRLRRDDRHGGNAPKMVPPVPG